MKKNLKGSPAYRQGQKDANILVKTGLSIWALCNLSQAWGFRRKNAKDSHKKLYRYCEGFCDCILKEAKNKGIEIKMNSWNAESPDQNDIGKEI